MPRPLSEQARHKALDAAQRLLAEGGIDGFTVDAVAKRSGVAKTTIYRHWESANELLVNALDCHVERIPTPDTGTIRDDLLQLFGTLRLMVNAPGTRQLLLDMASASARDPELDAVKTAMVDERTRPIREIVGRAIERREIPAIEMDMAAVLVEGPFIARMFMRSDPVAEAEIPIMVDYIARGLGAVLHD